MNIKHRISLLSFMLLIGIPALSAASLDEVFSPAEIASSITLPEADQGPKPISQVQPNLSGELQKVSGFAKVAFLITPEGTVLDPRIQSSSDARLEAPALAAISEWRFEPAKKGGSTVAVRVVIPFRFTGK